MLLVRCLYIIPCMDEECILFSVRFSIFGEQVIGKELIHDHLVKILEIQVILEQCSEFLSHHHETKEGTKTDASS